MPVRDAKPDHTTEYFTINEIRIELTYCVSPHLYLGRRLIKWDIIIGRFEFHVGTISK